MANIDTFLNRYVGIEKESAFGTSAGSPTYGEVDEESIGHKFDLMVREDMSRPISSKAVTGKEYSEGDISLAIQVDDFVGTVLSGFFPADTVTGASAPYTHTMQEPSTTSDEYPSFTLTIGREQKEHTFKGMCANTLNVAANVGEYAMMTAGFYGKAEEAVGTLSTPTYDGAALDALYFSNGTVKFAGGAATATIKSFSFDINLNHDADNAYALGSSTLQRMPPKQRREITGTIEFNQVLYTADEGSPTYSSLIAADGDEDNPSGSTSAIELHLVDEAGSDSIKFEFFHVFFEAPEASVSGRDTNTMTVNFTALYDDVSGGAGKAMTCTMVGDNLQSTAY